MKFKFAFILIVSFFVIKGATGLAAAQSDVNWIDGGITMAFQQAQATNKPVFALFYKENCGYCKKLKNELLPKPEVKEILDNFVLVQIDLNSGEGNQLKHDQRVFSSPVTILYEPDGREIDRIVGYFGEDEYVPQLLDYYQRVNTLDDYMRRYKENQNDPEVLYNLGKKLIDRRFDEDAFNYLVKTVDVDPLNTSGYTDDALYLMGAHLHRKQRNPEAALAPLEKILADYKDGDKAEYAYNRLMWCFTELKAPERMVSYYNKYQNLMELTAQNHRVTATELAKGWDNPEYLDIAMQAIQKALAMEPDDARNYSTLSSVEAALNHYDKAIDALTKAIDLDPDNRTYAMRLDRLRVESNNQ